MKKNVPATIGLFKHYTKRPNTLSKGSLYIAEITINTQNEDKLRKIRVYLPSNYDFNDTNKRYDVLYMMDGKNCFDDHTSFVGEWHADEWLEEDIIKRNRDYIIVGIDAPHLDVDRMQEMLPYDENSILSKHCPFPLKGYASLLADFIVDELSVIIDNTFHTNTNKRAIMGSSMGGIFSFYAAFRHKHYFSHCLSFSIPFFLYNTSVVKEGFKKYLSTKPTMPKVFMYCGAGDKFEGAFEPLNYYVYTKLKKKTDIVYLLDSKQIHNEKAWTKYYNEAIDFWFETK